MTIGQKSSIRVETAVGTQVQPGSSHLFICAECAYAQLYAVQPRALCTCAASPLCGKVVFAGQPACVTLARRAKDDLSLGKSLPATARWRSSFIAALARGAAVAAAALVVAAAVVAFAPAAQARPATHAQVARLHARYNATTMAPAAPARSSVTSTLLANAAFGRSGALIGGRTRVVLRRAVVAATGSSAGVAAGLCFILAMLAAAATAAALTARGPGRKGAMSWKGRATAPGSPVRPVQYR